MNDNTQPAQSPFKKLLAVAVLCAFVIFCPALAMLVGIIYIIPWCIRTLAR